MKNSLQSKRLAASPRRIAFLIYPHCDVLDLCGPLDAFHFANRALFNLGRAEKLYECLIVAATTKPIRSSCGLEVVPTHSFDDTADEFDTLIIAGGEDCEQSCKDDGLVGWVRSAAPKSRRVASVCTGAFILAAAGILDGRTVTTHWMFAELLAETFPSVQVDARLIFRRDGNVYTSGGVTSGIDLAFALIEEDVGQEIALATARVMVAFPHRPGGAIPIQRLLYTTEANPAGNLRTSGLDPCSSSRRSEHRGIGHAHRDELSESRPAVPERNRPDPGEFRRESTRRRRALQTRDVRKVYRENSR